jgi:phenylacetic acid degradation operon negative regulatory protein
MGPTAKSLILDLLATLRRGTMPVGALVEAGALFGIAGNAVRVALARLLASGHVLRDQRGSYRLGPKAAPVERRVGSWRDLDRATRAWSGGWIAIHHVARTASQGRREERGRARSLRLLGFRALAPGLSVRPDNLRDGAAELGREAVALGLPETDLVLAVHALGAAQQERAQTLWDVDALRTGYRERLRQIGDSEARLGRLAVDGTTRIEEAMVETFLLGGSIIRELVLDPLLPDAICPGDERRALVESLRRYDRLGRTAWAGFLRRFDVPHIRNPLDSHLTIAPERLAG